MSKSQTEFLQICIPHSALQFLTARTCSLLCFRYLWFKKQRKRMSARKTYLAKHFNIIRAKIHRDMRDQPYITSPHFLTFLDPPTMSEWIKYWTSAKIAIFWTHLVHVLLRNISMVPKASLHNNLFHIALSLLSFNFKPLFRFKLQQQKRQILQIIDLYFHQQICIWI